MAIITKATGHIQNIGTIGLAENGNILGTVGQCLRLEEFALWLELTGEHAGKDIGVEYEVHIQNKGWGQTFRNGEKAGTEGQGLRIEAVRIRLIGSDAAGNKIWYHPHVESNGWLGWCSDGESSGTEGGSLRVEALQIVVLSDSIDLTVDVTETFKKIEQPITLTPEIVITPAMQSAWGKYFIDYEFACDCIKGYDIPNPCDGWPETQYGKNPNLNPDLISAVNAFREYINCPVVPTCGTRCPSSNDYWGGVPNSLHRVGDAFDMTVPGQNIVEMARIMYQVFGKSVRVYPDQDFMHVEESYLDGVYNQEQGYYIY